LNTNVADRPSYSIEMATALARATLVRRSGSWKSVFGIAASHGHGRVFFSVSSPPSSQRNHAQKNGTRIPDLIIDRQFSSSLPRSEEDEELDFTEALSSSVDEDNLELTHQRIWRSSESPVDPSTSITEEEAPLYWSGNAVHNATTKNPETSSHNLANLLERIEKQELEGGRMRAKQYGVLHEDPVEDMRMLIENYTVTSLASALRDREEALQYCAQLASQNDFDGLKETLQNFHPDLVRRRREVRRIDVSKPLNATALETIRKALMRMPRRVTQAHSRRAGVVITICHVDGVPSLLLEKRSASLRAHPDEVCLPGGMVCSVADRTIVETCLREMKEEIGGLPFDFHNVTTSSSASSNSTTMSGTGINVLGVLRCNWGEVHHLVGVAVTPVVCFLSQDLANVKLTPNPDEVAEVFTIPLKSLLDKSQWIHKDDHAPIFMGGPYVIWGLTGYILERFWKDVLLPYNVKSSGSS
jgi:8-oxo-dGTP pyrophosphatase MutT (NUDIX family)